MRDVRSCRSLHEGMSSLSTSFVDRRRRRRLLCEWGPQSLLLGGKSEGCVWGEERRDSLVGI